MSHFGDTPRPRAPVPFGSGVQRNGAIVGLPSLRSAVIAAAIVGALVPGAAWATDHTDPSADNCKLYPGPGGPQSVQFCGADIATASDHLDPDGTAHIIVNTNVDH